MTQFAYFEGAIVPVDQAKIGITNNTFHYGTGCFAGIRGYWNDEQQQLYIFRIHDHYRRFSFHVQSFVIIPTILWCHYPVACKNQF